MVDGINYDGQKRHPHHDLSGGGLDLTLIQGQDQDQGQGQDQKWRQRSALRQQMVLALTLDLAQIIKPPFASPPVCIPSNYCYYYYYYYYYCYSTEFWHACRASDKSYITWSFCSCVQLQALCMTVWCPMASASLSHRMSTVQITGHAGSK